MRFDSVEISGDQLGASTWSSFMCAIAPSATTARSALEVIRDPLRRTECGQRSFDLFDFFIRQNLKSWVPKYPSLAGTPGNRP